MKRVESFLAMYKSKNTVTAYRSHLKTFFNHIYKGEVEDLEAAVERYFNEKRNYEADIQSLLTAIKDKPPFTVRSILTAVRTFLVENNVELPERFWRRMRRRVKGSRAVSEEKVPDIPDIRRILLHMPIHGRAVALALLSSGMRIGEALQLKLDDLELDKDPVKVNIRGEYTKTGNKRITFISQEAKEVILEWLKVRSQYIESAIAKTWHRYKEGKQLIKEAAKQGRKPTQREINQLIKQLSRQMDNRIFPFQDNTFYAIWSNALTKANLLKKDEKTNRCTIHPHVLRKFFRGQLGSFSVDLTEALMGHEGYLTEVYRRYPNPEKTLGEFYKKHELTLHVFTKTEDVTKLHKDLEEQREELQKQKEQLQTIINGLTAENMELKRRISEAEKRLSDMKKLTAENTRLKRRIEEAEKRIDNVEKLVKTVLERLV